MPIAVKIGETFGRPGGAILQAKSKITGSASVLRGEKIPLAIILGASEIEKGVVKVRDVVTREETDVPRQDLIADLKLRIKKYYESL